VIQVGGGDCTAQGKQPFALFKPENEVDRHVIMRGQARFHMRV